MEKRLQKSKYFPITLVGVAVVAILIVLGSYQFYFSNDGLNQANVDSENIVGNDADEESVAADIGQEGVELPAINLPDPDELAMMDMIGLIVYNGRIYTQTDTEFDTADAKNFVGEKLGTTKGNIDEWSSQDEYTVEFASTIGVADVYTVNGYDKDFRIMTYTDRGGSIHSEFYENLNGITVNSGADIIGKLNLDGNVEHAEWQTFGDWFYDKGVFYDVENMELLEEFVVALNDGVPVLYDTVEKQYGDYRNDEEYKQITLHLNDGSRVRMVLVKHGLVRYGFASVYFKVEDSVFQELWRMLETE